ncbi:MAG: hypothetical protein K1X29_07375 [Bdellovibrionales bacterium]|nr:hypothetical protein [Bdellovibrionales bacterium]
MNQTSINNRILWQKRLKEAGRVLLQYSYNPVEGMRNLPEWDWAFLLICQGLFAAGAGFLSGVVSKSVIACVTGLVFVPLSNALISFVLSGVFYYLLLFNFKKTVPFIKIYTQLVFAQLPALVIFMLSPLLPHLMLLGPLASLWLLTVGFVYNFQVERLKIQKTLGLLYIVFVILWVFNNLQNRHQVDRLMRDRATPESLDILENELKEQK